MLFVLCSKYQALEKTMERNKLKELMKLFCANYHCTFEKIANEAGLKKGNFSRIISNQRMTIDTYFAICDAMSKLSNMYDESYYLVRIKYALTTKDNRKQEQ